MRPATSQRYRPAATIEKLRDRTLPLRRRGRYRRGRQHPPPQTSSFLGRLGKLYEPHAPAREQVSFAVKIAIIVCFGLSPRAHQHSSRASFCPRFLVPAARADSTARSLCSPPARSFRRATPSRGHPRVHVVSVRPPSSRSPPIAVRSPRSILLLCPPDDVRPAIRAALICSPTCLVRPPVPTRSEPWVSSPLSFVPRPTPRHRTTTRGGFSDLP